ncbi:MAG: efflux RND transporter permease subunit [Candidatus Acetothermia bacterium]
MMKEKFLNFLYRLIRYRAYWILAVCFTLTILAAFYISDLEMKSSFLDLLPQNDPLVQEYQDREKTLGHTEYLTVVLTLEDGEEPATEEEKDKLLQVAEDLQEVLLAENEIESANYRQERDIPPEYSFLYALKDDQLGRLEDLGAGLQNWSSIIPFASESDRTIAEIYHGVNKEFEDSIGDESDQSKQEVRDIQKELRDFKELNSRIRETLTGLSKLSSLNTDLEDLPTSSSEAPPELADSDSKAFFSSDGRMLLLNAKPRFPSARGVSYCKKITSMARNKVAAFQENNRVDEGIQIDLTGPYVTTTDNDTALKQDTLKTTIISSVGILVVFFFGLGSKLYSLLIIIPLGIALLFTIAWAKFATGGFNLITSFLPALVLGLGIDYGIHLLVRFSEERSKSKSVSQALKTTVLRKGKGTLMAALTTALVFLSLLLAYSNGFIEMGVITSVGIMISFLVYVMVLPALLIVYQRWMGRKKEVELFDYRARLERMVKAILRRKRLIVILVSILTLLAAVQAVRIDFQFVSSGLAPDVKSSQISRKIQEIYGSQATVVGPKFIFFPDSEEELRNVSRQLEQLPEVRATESVQNYLPANLDRKLESLSNLEGIDEFNAGVEDLTQNLENREEILREIENLIPALSSLQFSSTMSSQGDITKETSELLDQLASIHQELENLDAEAQLRQLRSLSSSLTTLKSIRTKIDELPGDSEKLKDMIRLLPETIQNMFLTSRNEYIIYARLDGSIYQPQNLKAFVDKISAFSDDYFGTPLIQYRLEQLMRRDFWLSTICALLVISVILAVGIGSLKESLLAVIPLFLGYVWMLGG